MTEGQLMSLDDLKKENELEGENLSEEEKAKAAEEAEAQEAEEAAKKAEEEKAALQKAAEEGDEEAKKQLEELEKAEKPAWMEEEEVDPSKAGQIRRSTARKYQGKLEKKDSEIAELKEKIEKLEKGQSQPSQHLKDKPKREEFEDDDAYIEALTDYKIKIAREQDKSKTVAERQNEQKAARQREVNQAVDDHYIRATELAEKSGITPEAYQSADRNVREAVDSVFNEGGDAITDILIYNLGEGSEKVMYNLGVNAARRAKLADLLRQDSSGLKASAYLGELKAQLSLPPKRTTKAPDPMDDVKGDKAGSTLNSRELKKAYEKAHKEGDTQKAWDIKKKAKEQKVDTSSW